MKLSDQVCSLELAKRLKELGVKQESIYWWGGIGNFGLWCDHVKEDMPEQEQRFTWYSAFTVAELGELLPAYLGLEKFGTWFSCDKSEDEKWIALYGDNGASSLECEDKLEADARAKMLIYLIENKLLSIKSKE